MPEWLTEWVHEGDLSVVVVATRLTTALVLGAVVAGTYRLTRTGRTSATFPATLVLLCVLIAMVTLVIGNSVARAFSLVGALAIVRFRTVVEDTRDTAFVIFAVVVGMAVGANFLITPLVGIPIVALGAFVFGPRRRGGEVFAGTLTVRLGVGHGPALLDDVFRKHLERFRVVATLTARQGAALDLTWTVRLSPTGDAFSLVNELNQREGVQSVELRETGRA